LLGKCKEILRRIYSKFQWNLNVTFKVHILQIHRIMIQTVCDVYGLCDAEGKTVRAFAATVDTVPHSRRFECFSSTAVRTPHCIHQTYHVNEYLEVRLDR